MAAPVVERFPPVNGYAYNKVVELSKYFECKFIKEIRKVMSHLKSFLIITGVLECLVLTESINATLNYELVGEGFHRTIEYRINVDDLTEPCAVALQIDLPSSIYVNVDEIEDLKRLGKTTACSVGEIDVELFAEKAGLQNVTICEEARDLTSVLFSLPIHQRYQFSKENGGYLSIEIPSPKLLIGCKNRIKNHRVSKVELCSPCDELAVKWREVAYRTDNHDTKIWKIPVGNSLHLSQVSYVTLLVTSVGAAVVLKALLNL